MTLRQCEPTDFGSSERDQKGSCRVRIFTQRRTETHEAQHLDIPVPACFFKRATLALRHSKCTSRSTIQKNASAWGWPQLTCPSGSQNTQSQQSQKHANASHSFPHTCAKANKIKGCCPEIQVPAQDVSGTEWSGNWKGPQSVRWRHLSANCPERKNSGSLSATKSKNPVSPQSLFSASRWHPVCGTPCHVVCAWVKVRLRESVLFGPAFRWKAG